MRRMVRTFFKGLGFKARTPEEDLIRDAYIEMRRAYNRSAAEYRGQKRNGTVAGTVLVDKFGGIRRENGENKGITEVLYKLSVAFAAYFPFSVPRFFTKSTLALRNNNRRNGSFFHNRVSDNGFTFFRRRFSRV